MKLKKRGNITFFVLFSIILLVIVIITSIGIIRSKEETNNSVAFDSESVKLFVDDCLKKTFESCLIKISKTGGYYDKPQFSIYFENVDIANYFYNGYYLIPSIENIVREAEKCVDKEILSCTNNFEQWDNTNYAFDILNPKSEIILSSQCIANLNYKITIYNKNNAGTKIILKDFNYVSDFNFELLYKRIIQLTDFLSERQDKIPIDLIANYANSEFFEYNIKEYDDKNNIYTFYFYDIIGDNFMSYSVDHKLNNDENAPYKILEFNFGWSYLWNDLENLVQLFSYSQINSVSANNPILDLIQNQEVLINEKLELTFYASDSDNDYIYFYTEPNLKNSKINILNGDFEFTPDSSQIGIHNIKVIAMDDTGKSDSKYFKIIVR